MKQVIAKCGYNAGYGGASQTVSINGGDGDISDSSTFGLDYGRVPIPVGGTFSNLTIYSTAAGKPDYTVTLRVNGVDTALTCQMLAAATTASDTTHTVTVSAGDDVCYHVVSSVQGAGYPLAFCITFEGTRSIYGMSTGVQTGDRMGGALGNGITMNYTVPQDSNTYSIVATPGSVTHLILKSYGAGPGVTTFTGYLQKNGVLQDGTGGTVNTACALSGANTSATSTFTLPVQLGDHLDIVIKRTAGVGSLLLGSGVAFLGDNPDYYMFCGGNNSVISTDGWRWTDSEQLAATETQHAAPVNSDGLWVLGLYVERSTYPNTGETYTHVVRRNFANTQVGVTISDLATTGSDQTDRQQYVSGDLIDLSTLLSAGANSGELHWGIVASQAAPAPSVTYTVEDAAIVRLRQSPHATADLQRLFISKLQLHFQTGIGTVTTPDPQVMFSYSTNGGRTWSTERQLSAGAVGAYAARVIAWQLGVGRDWVFKVTVSDPVVPWALIGAYADGEKGLN